MQIGPFTIRQALYEEAEALALLMSVAQVEKNSKDSFGSSFPFLGSEIRKLKTTFQRQITEDKFALYVAEADDFESLWQPIRGANGRQLAGFSSLKHQNNLMNVSLLYAIKSGKPTGSALLSHALVQAMDENAEEICVVSLKTKRTMDFYKDRFGPSATLDEYTFYVENEQMRPVLERISKQTGLQCV